MSHQCEDANYRRYDQPKGVPLRVTAAERANGNLVEVDPSESVPFKTLKQNPNFRALTRHHPNKLRGDRAELRGRAVAELEGRCAVSLVLRQYPARSDGQLFEIRSQSGRENWRACSWAVSGLSRALSLRRSELGSVFSTQTPKRTTNRWRLEAA